MSKVKLTMNVAKFNDTMRASKELAHYLGVDGSVFDKWKTKGQSITTHTGKTLTLPRPYDEELKDNYKKMHDYSMDVYNEVSSALGVEKFKTLKDTFTNMRETLQEAIKNLRLSSVPFNIFSSSQKDLDIYFDSVEQFKVLTLQYSELLKLRECLVVLNDRVFDVEYS